MTIEINSCVQSTLDVEISPRDVQALDNADAVTAFFARLGYNTEVRTPQTPGNLGITADGLVRSVKRIELIADQESLFQVYLFELSNLTIANTRALARAFRNRAGNYLLVLTSNYDRLDFVLLEKYLPTDIGGGSKSSPMIAQKQVGVRPRPLTLVRRKPERVHLRVLKRLTWTEADPFAQYDKMLSAYSVADWSEEYFNNRALFSDYYLLERLREFPAWADDLKPAYLRFRQYYLGAATQFAGKEESLLRQKLIEPVLHTLGFTFKPGKDATSSASEADYHLYANDQHTPLALALVYPWGRLLDAKDYTRDSLTPDENPGAIVVSLLEAGEAPWVIVTNGKLWRLYAGRTHSKATNYYEIDLEEVLAEGGSHAADPAESFRYFWLLFRRQAFEPTTVEREGRQVSLAFLDRLLLESEDYAKELGERLKERIFTQVFPHLATGFITHIKTTRGNRAASFEQGELNEIFQGTLTLLYRLLFLLYAESRDLLPVRETRDYYEASLTKLKREVADAGGRIGDEVVERLKRHYPEDRYELYDRLTKLFRAIDKGNNALNVPFYNGGLFLCETADADNSPEAQAARFLDATKVPDRFLARALDLLARDLDPKRQDLVFIDYKSLGVRHLGSIYEGLLEFKLRIASHKLAVVKEKGREVYADFSQLKEKDRERAERQKRIIHKGEVYLENDKRERKATGSYYTPDYIVQYIVQHAVGPVLEEKFEQMRPKLREAERWHHEAIKSARAKGENPDKYEFGPAVEQKWASLVDELFNVKVLDPAMGSGHFLVEVVDYITDRAIDFLNGFRWNPIIARLRQMRDTILEQMEEQEIIIDAAQLKDVNLLKRHVLKSCIYGVDLNPMAVELAKVSLWLHCFTLGAPLSFLDHHLRCGNSLIGVTVKEVQEALEETQMTLFGSRFAGLKLAAVGMAAVGAMPDVTSEQVKRSRSEYHKASDALAPFKRILDVYTSQWFADNEEKKAQSKKSKKGESVALDFLKSREAEAFLNAQDEKSLHRALASLIAEDRQAAENALCISAKKRFFHWELEFPEVFYGASLESKQIIERLESAGFDAVIGNPPYIAVDSLSKEDRQYLPAKYLFLHRKYDVMSLFLSLVGSLCCSKGRLGMIVPLIWETGINYAKFRAELLTKFARLDRLVNLPFDVFPEAYVDTSVVILQRNIPNINKYDFLCKVYNKRDSAEDLTRVTHSKITFNMTKARLGEGIVLGEVSELARFMQDRSKFAELGMIVECSQGPVESFLSLGRTLEQRETIDAIYAVPEVDRYECAVTVRKELIGFPSEIYNKFYQTERILARRILSRQDRLLFGLASEPFVCKKDFNPIVIRDKDYRLHFLLAVLNSTLISRLYMTASAISQKDDFRQTTLGELKKLPIRRIAFTTPATRREAMAEEGRTLYEQCLSAQTHACLVEFANYHISQQPEETDVIHDLLAYLAEQMIEMNKRKQYETKRFTGWLEKELKIEPDKNDNQGIESLSGKTIIKSYLGDYQKAEEHAQFNKLWEVLIKNSRRCGRKLDMNFKERAQREYDESLAVLLPIKQRLAATDSLIDEVVYRLYGLTLEEIAIVKSLTKRG